MNVNLQENRCDAVDFEEVKSLLIVTFAGVTAVVNVVNLILNIQGRKQQKNVDSSASDSSISLNIKLGIGRNLEMKLPANLSNVEVESYISVVKGFIEDSSKLDKSILSTDSSGVEEIVFSEVNLLFDKLLDSTRSIRELHSEIIDNGDTITAKISLLRVSLLKILRKGNQEQNFYLPSSDVEACKEIFFQFEIFQILSFREIEYDIKMLDFENACVRFEIERLNSFDEIIRNPAFKYYSFFNA